ncbi:hypothetical protein HYALB_00006752 [Hymenoscyphus albidus]|uniref:Stc1 domain-containing protein n=1 Tax=Hymenoscyphus albidus TaxID=595503 RepID=A0A9N9M1U9_9HELO|nr:hypothetical protein HYALB_00006752 [Hymenoscyphus albidus]
MSQHRQQNKKSRKPRTNKSLATPPNFSAQCHFTQYNFKCKHHTWLENPKITHVPPCKCKQHKNLCGNMAKANKEVWFDEMCESCQSLVPVSEPNSSSGLGLGLDSKLPMAQAVRKRILELEHEQEQNAKTPQNAIATTLSPPLNPALGPEPLTLTSNWGLDEPPIPRTTTDPKIQPTERADSKSSTEQKTVSNNQTTTNPKSTTQNNDAHAKPSPKSSDIDFDDDDSDDDEEQFRIGKDRVQWLSMPVEKNGEGSADKEPGIIGKVYNTLRWKSTPKFVLKEPEPKPQATDEAKEDSDSDMPWEDHGEWVHVTENVEEN